MASSAPQQPRPPWAGRDRPRVTRVAGIGPTPTLPLAGRRPASAGRRPGPDAGRHHRRGPRARLHALAAAGALGFDVRRMPRRARVPAGRRAPPRTSPSGGAGARRRTRRAVAFVALDEPHACPRCAIAPQHSAPAPPRPLPVRDRLRLGSSAAAAHRRHGCVDAVLPAHGVVRRGRASRTCRRSRPSTAPAITAREADVLVLLLAGLDGPAVARRLGLSPATARTHGRAILRKLGAGRPAGAARPAPRVARRPSSLTSAAASCA